MDAAPDLQQRSQHFTLSAALELPFEQAGHITAAEPADRLHDEAIRASVPNATFDELDPPKGRVVHGVLHADGTLADLRTDRAVPGAFGELGPLAADSGPSSARSMAPPRAAGAEATAAMLAQWTEQGSHSPARRDEADASEATDEPNAARLDPDTARRLLARYAREPTALQVARAAVSAAEHDPQRFASMIERARWRGLVPDLTIGARRGQGVDLRTMVTQDETVRFTSGDDLVLSATLRFELGRLLFAPEEIAIAREARAARNARLELTRDIIHWYAIRRRLMLERDLLGYTSLAREAKIAELEALLDIFTSGAFGRMILDQRSWTTGESTRDSKRP